MNPIPSEDFPDIIYPICAIRDALTQFYPCSVEESLPAARRNFSMAVNGAKGAIAFSPGDYTLFHVGNFNTKKGTIEPVFPIEQVCTGLDVYGEVYEKS